MVYKRYITLYKCLSTASRQILLYADYTKGRIMTVSPQDSGSLFPLPISNISNPVALDYDVVEDRVYWTDVGKKTISRAFLNGSSHEIIFDRNVQAPHGLAVDSLGRNIYWTDAGTKMLEVSKLNGSRRTSLLTHNLYTPRDIILDVYKGLVQKPIRG